VLAGLSLIPFTFKPHLAVLLMVAVFVWSSAHRRWRVLCSSLLAFTSMAAICLVLNPHIFTQYAALVKGLFLLDEVYPNISGALYATTGVSTVRFVPILVGLVFLVWRLRRVVGWDWKLEMPLIAAVGVATSFYSY